MKLEKERKEKELEEKKQLIKKSSRKNSQCFERLNQDVEKRVKLRNHKEA